MSYELSWDAVEHLLDFILTSLHETALGLPVKHLEGHGFCILRLAYTVFTVKGN